jgi:DNA-binding FadR family transcriptional regulator
MYQYQDKYLPREEKVIKLLLKDFREISMAIESKDPEKARELMHQHVYKFNRLAEENQSIKKGPNDGG